MTLATVLLQSQPDTAEIQRIFVILLPLMGIFMLIGVAVVMVPFWFILKKAGFSPWLSMLNLVPMGNLILLYVLAFSDWKVMPVPPYPVHPAYPPVYPPQI